jgi:nucleoside-diphosphate-sugar epimerase
MTPQRVLVTGGAGYIGSILVPALLDKGYGVRVLDKFIYGQTSLLDCCINSRLEIVRGDCRDKQVLCQAMRDVDYVLPLAAMVGAPICDADKIAATSTNLEAIRLLVSLRSSQQRLVFPCTNSGYGIGEQAKYCTEETPLRPISLYGTSKVEAESAILDSGAGISLRLATVFGVSPRMRTDLLVNDFVHRAVTDRSVLIFEGHFKRNYIHIRDVARAFLHAMEKFDTLRGEPYNVGLSDANLSKLELCAKIREHVPGFLYFEAPIGEDPDKRDYIVSNEKIERTGFRPAFSLDDGIEELKRAYQILRTRQFGNY